MGFFQCLKDIFMGRAEPPPPRVFPEKMYREEISKPGSAIRVYKLHLTEKQFQGLCVKKPNVRIPGADDPVKWRKYL